MMCARVVRSTRAFAGLLGGDPPSFVAVDAVVVVVVVVVVVIVVVVVCNRDAVYIFSANEYVGDGSLGSPTCWVGKS